MKGLVGEYQEEYHVLFINLSEGPEHFCPLHFGIGVTKENTSVKHYMEQYSHREEIEPNQLE